MSSGSQSAASNRKVLPIARSFIVQYYRMMSESPQELHKFYKDQSDFIHPIIGKDESAPEINVRGISAIRDRVRLLNLGGMKVSLEGGGIDAQPSDNECVLIICNGFITTEPNAAPLAFAQTFVLAPQESSKKSFFVRNSVFRLINGGVVPRSVTNPPTPVVGLPSLSPRLARRDFHSHR